jgi:hypothetical protein
VHVSLDTGFPAFARLRPEAFGGRAEAKPSLRGVFDARSASRREAGALLYYFRYRCSRAAENGFVR